MAFDGSHHAPRDSAEVLRVLAHRVGRSFRSARRDMFALGCMDDHADVFALLAKSLQKMGSVLCPRGSDGICRAPRGTSELFELLVALADTYGNHDSSTTCAPPTCDPAETPFSKQGAEYVCESVGASLTTAKMQPHLKASAKEMVLSALPRKTHTVGMGVSQCPHKPSLECVSRASCTTNVLAPLEKRYKDKFDIRRSLSTTTHAMAARQPTVEDGQSLKFDDPETKDVVGAITSLVESKGGKAKAEDIFEEVRMHQLAKLFDHKVRLYIVLVALCGDKMDAKSLATHKKVVTHLIENGKMPAADILWTFDAYLSQNSAAQKGFPMVLKAIYDEEWVGEPAILAYYNEDEGSGEPGFDEAKKSAAPFLMWLATAGSDDDDSDDDDDESDFGKVIAEIAGRALKKARKMQK